ncbi:MAG: hypothetical protein IJ141_03400 [Lachnospiraceae bacterium]|nr:hypothetical protein [Lachnospiraceae bacterium]
MKKILICLMVFALILTGCGKSSDNKSTDKKSDNPLVGKIYGLNKNPQNNKLDFEWMVFYDDNTFRGIFNNWKVDTKTKERTDNFETTYGTYKLDGSSLTVSVGDKDYSFVVIDNGNELMIDDVGWLDFSDGNFSDEFINAISK